MSTAITLSPVRCPKCQKKLAERVKGEADIRCRWCKSIVRVNGDSVVAFTVLGGSVIIKAS